MEKFFPRYKRKVRYLLGLCIQAKEKGVTVDFGYDSTSNCVTVNFFKGYCIVDSFRTFLHHPGAEKSINIQIQYVKKLIEIANG